MRSSYRPDRFTVAIDGPAASGKGTLARGIAETFDFGQRTKFCLKLIKGIWKNYQKIYNLKNLCEVLRVDLSMTLQIPYLELPGNWYCIHRHFLS